jgi:hypothetical protein
MHFIILVAAMHNLTLALSRVAFHWLIGCAAKVIYLIYPFFWVIHGRYKYLMLSYVLYTAWMSEMSAGW